MERWKKKECVDRERLHQDVSEWLVSVVTLSLLTLLGEQVVSRAFLDMVTSDRNCWFLPDWHWRSTTQQQQQKLKKKKWKKHHRSCQTVPLSNEVNILTVLHRSSKMLYFHQWDPRAEAPRTALRVWTDRWTVGGLYKQHVLIYSSLAVKEKRSYSLAAPANELNNTQPVEREAAAERLAIRRAAGEAWHFQANRQKPRESCDGTLVNAKPGRAKVEKKKST